MLRPILLSLASAALALLGHALTVQVPFASTSHLQNKNTVVFNSELEDHAAEWNLDRLPSPDDTDRLVFETVHSLLQHWPNTRMRNGHNIVPGVIPKGTLLYHGANSSELPPGADWVSTDPEHSYLFCRDGRRFNYLQQGCWQLTLVTTRPLKIVYFDGSSAAKLPYGSLDTQDLLVWGKIDSGGVFNEWQRVEGLCKWGKSFGVDGFVRMEMDFEVMLCDFTSGVNLVSFLNLPSRRSVSPMMSPAISFEVMNSGSWHNHFPGETRVQLNLAGLVSFYDTQLVPSLVAIRAGQERWDHRVQNISSEDLSTVKSRLEEVLMGPSGPSSGIDWKTHIQVIVDRFSGRLELTRYLLNSSRTNDLDRILDLANKTQTLLRIMLTPYILFSTTPSNTDDLDWTKPIYKLCATTHTYPIEFELESMTDSERLILRAVRGTSREICRVVTKMWAAGVYAGLDPTLATKESLDIAGLTQIWNSWEEDLNQLMSWLDWSVWVRCDPVCGPEEMCYLPTWPAGFPRSRSSPPDPHGLPLERLTSFDLRAMVLESLAEEISDAVKPALDDWVRPQPRCVRRIAPYDSEIWNRVPPFQLA